MFLIVFFFFLKNAIISFTGLYLQLWWVLLTAPFGFVEGHCSLLVSLVYLLWAAWASTTWRTKWEARTIISPKQCCHFWACVVQSHTWCECAHSTMTNDLYLWCLTDWLPLSGEGTSGNDWGPAKLDSIIFSSAVTGCLSAFEYCGESHAQGWAGGWAAGL